LLNIHREREISSEQVVDVFARKRKKEHTPLVLVPSVNDCVAREDTVSLLVFGTIDSVYCPLFS